MKNTNKFLSLLMAMIISTFLPVTMQAQQFEFPIPKMVLGISTASWLIPVVGVIVVGFLLLLFFISRYRRCSSDKILVIFGKTGTGQSAKCSHGGAAFVWPVIQDYDYLDLSPIDVDIDLRGALSKQNIRIDVPAHFTVAITTEPDGMLNAAERLLRKSKDEIRQIAKEIIFGQIRQVIATMSIEEINSDREKFLAAVRTNVETELKKIGLHLINVNLTDIRDQSGYIEALGKEAAANVIADAKVKVAEAERQGEIGRANADRDRRIQVAQAESDAAVGEAEATARATEGKNKSTIAIEQSNSLRAVQVAEAQKVSTASARVQSALAEKEALTAEKDVQEARKAVEKAKKEADEIVDQEIEKRKAELLAEADAYTIKQKATATAEALYTTLENQAKGIEALVKAAGGNPKDAAMLLLIDQIKDLSKIQAEAIKNIKVDKLTVFDGGNGNGLSNAVTGLFKTMPALSEFLQQSGLNLPELLGGAKGENNGKPVAPTAEVATTN